MTRFENTTDSSQASISANSGRLLPSPALSAAASELTFPDVPGAVLALVEISDRMADLDPAEASLVAGSVAKRQREFSSARYAAHQASQLLGQIAKPLLRDDERRPLWPSRLCGSISHSTVLAGALVTDAAAVGGIGLDIETAGRVENGLLDRLLTEREQRALDGDPARLFSAKEAVYKAVNPRLGRYIDFRDVEVLPSSTDIGSFRMRYVGAQVEERIMEEGAGCWRQLAGEWISVFWLPAGPS